MPGRRAAHPQQRLLSPAPLATRRRDHGRQERGERRPREAKEEEEQLGVDRVARAASSRAAEVVADEPGAGERGLEVLRSPHDLRERRPGVGGEVRASSMWSWVASCRAGDVPANSSRHVAAGSSTTLSGGAVGRRTGVRADRLEQRVGGRQIHDAVDA